MKKVLILTYYWPPSGGPGVQRVLKFAKYLPEFGWQPIILTVKNGEYPALDHTLKKDIPKECIVYKVKSLDPTGIYKRFVGMKKEDKIPVAALAAENDNLGKRIAHWVRLNLFIPDAKVGLISPFVKKAKEIIKEHHIDVILASSPPHSLQIAANRLSKKHHLPWVCDLRDPWTDIYHYDNIKRFILSDKFNHSLEHKVITNADKLITVSPYFTRRFNHKANRDDAVFIPNGFDRDDLDNRNAERKHDETFQISYVGNMSPNQNVEVFWQVIKDLSDKDALFKERFKLCLVGDIQEKVKQSISETGIDQYVSYLGYLPHNEAFGFIKNSDALLFIVGRSKHNKGVLTGKIFEYFSTKNPILSIGPTDGDAAKIISDVNKISMRDYDDYDGLYHNLSTLFTAWKDKTIDNYRSSEDTMKYSRKALTGELVTVLNGLAAADKKKKK